MKTIKLTERQYDLLGEIMWHEHHIAVETEYDNEKPLFNPERLLKLSKVIEDAK